MKADPVCICFVTEHHYTCSTSFSLFYTLLFSVHIVNVNAAKSSTVLDNLSVNIYRYLYTHIYFFKLKVAILETLRVCYFRGTSLSRTRFLFFYQSTAF